MHLAAFKPQQARVFTEFVRSTATATGDGGGGDDDGGGQAGTEPSPRRLAEVVGALRAALRSEMRRRGLWESPPSYLGIYGWDSWAGGRPGSADKPLAGVGAFEELLAECYSFIFVERLRSLRAQLSVKPNIDGLVFLNIRHFLHDRQKEHDPVGFRVFEMVWAAVARRVAAGELHVLDGDPKVRNDTVLGFQPDADVDARPPMPAAFASWVSEVDDALLPGLLTARGERQTEVVAALAERLSELPGVGVPVLLFKDLLDPFKDDVRARWAAILRGGAVAEDGETAGGRGARGGAGLGGAGDAGAASWIEAPGHSYEERESFRALISCVLLALERVEIAERTRTHLSTLWQYLRFHSAEGGTPASHDAEPSAAGSGALEGHPTARWPICCASRANSCRSCSPSWAGWSTDAGRAVPPEGRRDWPAPGSFPMSEGDLLVLRETAEFPVEWAVVAPAVGEESGGEAGESGEGRTSAGSTGAGSEPWLVVPADTNPATGSGDVRISPRATTGPLTLRCGFAVRVPAALLAGGVATGRLDGGDLARARNLVRAPAGSAALAAGSPLERETDSDPEYLDWIESTIAPAARALEAAAAAWNARRLADTTDPGGSADKTGSPGRAEKTGGSGEVGSTDGGDADETGSTGRSGSTDGGRADMTGGTRSTDSARVDQAGDAAREDAGGTPDPAAGDVLPFAPRRRWTLSPSRLAVAALLVLSVGLSWSTFSLWRQVERLSQPLFGPPSGEVLLGGPNRDPLRQPVRIKVPPDASHILLTVVLGSNLPAHTMGRLEIQTVTGQPLWSSPVFDLKPAEERSLVVSRDLVPGRRYLLVLYGQHAPGGPVTVPLERRYLELELLP